MNTSSVLSRPIALILSLVGVLALPGLLQAAPVLPYPERLIPTLVGDEIPPLLSTHEHTGGCGKACRARLLAQAGYQFNARSTPLPSPKDGTVNADPALDTTDVLNNAIDIEVVPGPGTITGSNTITARSLVSNLTTFPIQLRIQYTIPAALGIVVTDPIGTYTLPPSALSAPPAGSYRRILTLSRPIGLNQQFSLRINYTGTAVNVGFGTIAFTNNPCGQTEVSSLSEPYYAGTWFPCKDGDLQRSGDNIDKATLSIAITAPSSLVSTANGVLQSITTPAAGKSKYTFVSNYLYPTYLICFATSNYSSWTYNYNIPGGGTMPVIFNAWACQDTPAARTATARVINMLETLAPVYGVYPFVNEKYGIYQFQFGGGMEHQTNTGQGTLTDDILSVHELGHQWWGDNVTCRTWNDIWLNEGFATYTEALWLERQGGSSNLAALQAAMNDRRPSSLTGTVYCTDVTNLNSIFSTANSYDKASWVLHMHRKIVGDTTFFQTLANYRAQYQGSAASTQDFINSASATAGQDLAWFFTPWLYSPGAPNYRYALQPATINGQNYARVRVQQVQTSPMPIYDMPLDVRITTSAGSTIASVRVDAASDYFLIPLPAPAVSMTLDESDWVLTSGKSSVAYVAGPPKLIGAAPAPGTIITGTGPTQASIVFSDDVSIAGPNVEVTRAGSPVPFTLNYVPTTQTATLTFAAPLTSGSYSVRVLDAVTANGQALDGEIASPTATTSFPTGNGQAGGASLFTFSVVAPPCPVDFDNDGIRAPADIFAFLNAYFANDPRADFDGNGTRQPADIFAFLNAYFLGCP